MNRNLYIPCPNCGAINRADLEKIEGGPRCAKCKTKLDSGRAYEVVNANQFNKVVLESGLPVLVDFYSSWCGPCKSMHPVVEEVAKRNKGKALVVKVNTDNDPATAQNFGIRGVPTFILFQDGKEAKRLVGAAPMQSLESLIAGAHN